MKYKYGDFVEVNSGLCKGFRLQITGSSKKDDGSVTYSIGHAPNDLVYRSLIDGVSEDMLDKVGFVIGDLITGIDRTYTRSIYKIVSLDPFGIEIHSLCGVVPNNIDELKNTQEIYYAPKENIGLYRLATKEEIHESET